MLLLIVDPLLFILVFLGMALAGMRWVSRVDVVERVSLSLGLGLIAVYLTVFGLYVAGLVALRRFAGIRRPPGRPRPQLGNPRKFKLRSRFVRLHWQGASVLLPASMAPHPSSPAVTVVLPIFNEEAVLPELLARLTALFDAHAAVRWDALLVDDGSRDRSAELIRAHAARDPRFALLELSRNFGFQAALAAGLTHAAGDAVVTMDADLQDPPECIPEMVAKWREGAQVVRAVRLSRQETGPRRLGMDLFHAVFRRVSDFPIEANTGTFGLMDRAAVDALKQLPERNRFFPGLRSWVGFQTTEIHYDRQIRAAGQPQQTFRRLIRYATDGVFSFSYLPLRLLTYAGIFIAFLGFSAAIFYAARRLIGIETAPTGYTTLVTIVLFLGGVQLIGIGVLGEYLGRIYDEVKHRPLFLLRRNPPPAVGKKE